MKIPTPIATLIAGIAITLISLWVGQNNGLMPVAASEEALEVDGLFNLMITIATALFILIEGALIISIFKFRKLKGDETDGPPIHGNVPLEIVWTGIPVVIVLVLSIYSFEVYNRMGGLDPMASGGSAPTEMADSQQISPSDSDRSLIAMAPNQGQVALGLGASPENQGKDPALSVDVMGLQYAWIFTYPDTGIVSGELHIPEGQEVKLNLTATDVLHAFWMPEFRIKQDAIPGRTAQMRFTATKVGEYPIICAELCGSYHGSMKTQIFVHTPEDYQQWVQQQQLASTDNLEQAVAVNPAQLSEQEFLAPYASEMGVDAQTIEQLNASSENVAEFLATSN
ncbi:MAG: cytochrome c oxidase subunit II [Symploca sp. SIO2E9]|nr:cytochrome c oxidase subunit II [Symploca sp. SIO2E9]